MTSPRDKGPARNRKLSPPTLCLEAKRLPRKMVAMDLGKRQSSADVSFHVKTAKELAASVATAGHQAGLHPQKYTSKAAESHKTRVTACATCASVSHMPHYLLGSGVRCIRAVRSCRSRTSRNFSRVSGYSASRQGQIKTASVASAEPMKARTPARAARGAFTSSMAYLGCFS